MDKREKIEIGLEHCIVKLDSLRNRAHGFNCTDCPYYEACEKSKHLDGLPLLRDVLELLEAQEPRMLTFDEAVEAHECWFESINGAYGYCDIYPFNKNIVEIYRLRNHTEGIDIDGYGKRWRCWTFRPTDEQREAVSWDG